MRALDRKALRDLAHMRGQVLAIGLVLACGVATFVMSMSTLRSLERTLDTYYERHRFAEVFAHLERAPRTLADRLAEIPGVAQVQTRVVEAVTLDMPGLSEPAAGRLISLQPGDAPGLNDLYMRRGRAPESRERREVLVGEAFALAHELELGDTVEAVMNGRYETLTVTGIVLSPEYIYQLREGDLLPDAERFGVFWMRQDEIEAAFDMAGAFNDVALTLMPGAREPDVIRQVDDLTRRYGGLGAYGRDEHVSHEFVANEIRELKGTATIVPSIFLAVAAFLLNVVLSRLVATQREQIAAIKALGYTNVEIATHYLRMVVVIAVLGVIVGTGVGAWMGNGLTQMYARFFHFPIFEYHLSPWVVVLALAITGGAAVVGTLAAVRRAVSLPPAEAMRPQPPSDYRPTFVERIGLQRLLSPALRMIMRQLERRPGRTALSCVGIALATSILVVGNFIEDSIDVSMELQFERVQRGDMMVTFTTAATPDALAEIAQLPGVHRCEPFRAVATRLRAAHRFRRVGVMGLDGDGELYRLTNLDGTAVSVPPGGLVLSQKLAEILEVEIGDSVTMEVLQESRPVREVEVTGVVAEFAGVTAYMELDALNRIMRQEGVLVGAHIASDPAQRASLHRTLKETPGVAGVTSKDATIESFRATLGESMMMMKTVNVIFAVIIAFGVVYNGARISLSERAHELATLRVIGFTRAEISLIQLGELAILVIVSVPVGLLVGYGLAALTSNAFDTELFRIPLVVDRATYGFAAAVVVAAAVFSGLVVRRLLDRLDLVAVLKTRE